MVSCLVAIHSNIQVCSVAVNKMHLTIFNHKEVQFLAVSQDNHHYSRAIPAVVDFLAVSPNNLHYFKVIAAVVECLAVRITIQTAINDHLYYKSLHLQRETLLKSS